MVVSLGWAASQAFSHLAEPVFACSAARTYCTACHASDTPTPARPSLVIPSVETSFLSTESMPEAASVFAAVPRWMPSALAAMLLRLRLAEVSAEVPMAAIWSPKRPSVAMPPEPPNRFVSLAKADWALSAPA